MRSRSGLDILDVEMRFASIVLPAPGGPMRRMSGPLTIHRQFSEEHAFVELLAEELPLAPERNFLVLP